MKLIDLEPEWISPHMFIFKSPVGAKDYLTCKSIPMTFMEQHNLVYVEGSKYKGKVVVFSEDNFPWIINGYDFNQLDVYPSIDCSASGNWHGFIINGELIGGLE